MSIKYVGVNTLHYASVLSIQLRAQKSIAVLEMGSNTDIFIIVTNVVFGYDSKVRSKFACMVHAAVNYDEPIIGHVFILLINQVIETKGHDHCLLCPMQCSMKSVVIDEVSKLLVPILSETTHAILIINPFDAIHPHFIPLQLIGVTSYFDVRKSL